MPPKSQAALPIGSARRVTKGVRRSQRPYHRGRTASASSDSLQWSVAAGSEETKAIYTARAATAECVTALARERGLTRLRVRGKAKVRLVVWRHALAHNLMRIVALTSHLLGDGKNPRGQLAAATQQIEAAVARPNSARDSQASRRARRGHTMPTLAGRTWPGGN